MITFNIGRAKVRVDDAGCIDCGTEHSSGWTRAGVVAVTVGRRQSEVMLHRCADCTERLKREERRRGIQGTSTVVALAFFFFALSAHAQVAMPNPALTPGVRDRALIEEWKQNPATSEVCTKKWGKDRRFVTMKMKLDVCSAYGKTPADCLARDPDPGPNPQHKTHPRNEFDHLISRENAGKDDEKNLWFQPWGEARTKDLLENLFHRMACASPPQIQLDEVDDELAMNWWAAYRKYFPGREAPGNGRSRGKKVPPPKKKQPAKNPLADRLYFEEARR
jgi:hypothetical protein